MLETNLQHKSIGAGSVQCEEDVNFSFMNVGYKCQPVDNLFYHFSDTFSHVIRTSRPSPIPPYNLHSTTTTPSLQKPMNFYSL